MLFEHFYFKLATCDRCAPLCHQSPKPSMHIPKRPCVIWKCLIRICASEIISAGYRIINMRLARQSDNGRKRNVNGNERAKSISDRMLFANANNSWKIGDTENRRKAGKAEWKETKSANARFAHFYARCPFTMWIWLHRFETQKPISEGN